MTGGVWRQGSCVSIRPPKRRGPQRTRVVTCRAFAALAAIVALAAVMPNGRDYVRGNGGSTLPAALEEHRIAFQALSAIHERMETILDHVANS